MNRKSVLILTVTFLFGAAVGAIAARRGIDPSTYRGKSKKEAAAALLELSRAQAGNGSWERIAVGRAYYLGGMKKEGEEIFDAITSSKKVEGSDWIRVGRVYWESKEWEKAKSAFDKALQKNPNDAPWLAEIGAYYNLKGEREKAEELFDRSLKLESGEVWNTVNVAGSYAGVEPRGNS